MKDLGVPFSKLPKLPALPSLSHLSYFDSGKIVLFAGDGSVVCN